MRSARRLQIALVVMLASIASQAGAQQRPAQTMRLFGAAPAGNPAGEIPGMRPETVGDVAYVSLAPAATSSLRARGAAPRQMQIALPGGRSVTCVLRAQSRPGGMVLMRGAPVAGDAGGRCNLVVDKEQVTGEIDTGSGRYQIVPLGSGRSHAVVELRTAEFPNEMEADVAPGAGSRDPVAQSNAPLCDVKPRPGQRPKAFGPVRIMFVYTPAARSGTANIRAEIELMMNQAREAFSLERTGGNFSVAVELAHVQEINYTEEGMSADLRQLSDPKDPTFRTVHALRNRHRADLVHMLIKRQQRDGCGIGWVNLSMTAESGFSLSDRQCALGVFSALHEIGHNFGLAHDRYVVSEEKQRPGDFNFGFVAVQQGFRTVMSYQDECVDTKKRCPRVLHFSSPNVQHKGVAIGRPLSDPNSAYNLEQLCRNAPTVTRFR